MESEGYKHQSSHVGHIAFVILAFIIGGVIGYAVGQDWELAKNTEDNAAVSDVASTSKSTATSTSTSAASTSTTTADPTAGWKTYTNSTYGFSFKYPSSWTGSNSGNNSDGVVFSWTADDQDGMFNGLALTVSTKSIDSLSLSSVATKTQSTVGGLTWTVVNYPASETEHTPNSVSYLTTKNGKTYVLNNQIVSGDSNATKATLDNIISTFQFTN
jgi:hypothetical protein